MSFISSYYQRSILLLALLVSCSTQPVIKYSDSYFSNKDSNNEYHFTYILNTKNTSNNNKPPKNKRSSASVPISIAFEMEEEAFKRVKKILTEKKLCGKNVIYDTNKYSWLRYTIKGHCTIMQRTTN